MSNRDNTMHDDGSSTSLVQNLLINIGVLTLFLGVGFLVVLVLAAVGPLRLPTSW